MYTGGNTASENGTNYTANWWTQGNDPATNSGPSGSGQPWTATGGCTSGGGSDGSGGGGGGGGGTVCGLVWVLHHPILTRNADESPKWYYSGTPNCRHESTLRHGGGSVQIASLLVQSTQGSEL